MIIALLGSGANSIFKMNTHNVFRHRLLVVSNLIISKYRKASGVVRKLPKLFTCFPNLSPSKG